MKTFNEFAVDCPWRGEPNVAFGMPPIHKCRATMDSELVDGLCVEDECAIYRVYRMTIEDKKEK